MMSEPLIEVVRGPLVESLHRGAVAVVDATGQAVAHVGDPRYLTYVRSSAKPWQAVSVVESGAAEAFGFTAQELAVMAGSHNGEPHQTATVLRILGKIGLPEEALECGIHEPLDRETRLQLWAEGQPARAIHNNCSGKHAAMLALAVHSGLPTQRYYVPEHPIQQRILAVVSDLAGLAPAEVLIGVDGCGVPVFGMRLSAAALAFARLVDPPCSWPAARRMACRRVTDAMLAHPDMVAGRRRICTDLMRVGSGRLVAKSGAEGFYAVGIQVGALPGWSAGLGVAIKIEDGNRARARDPVVIETLQQLGLLGPAELTALEAYGAGPIRNHRGETVGQLRPCFSLTHT
jgi:L-asparaginase II